MDIAKKLVYFGPRHCEPCENGYRGDTPLGDVYLLFYTTKSEVFLCGSYLRFYSSGVGYTIGCKRGH